MRKSFAKFLFATLAFYVPFGAEAQDFDFKAEGICYKIISDADKTVGVTSGERNAETLKIPASVKNEAEEYSVISVEDGAFMDCSALVSVSIPESVTSIGRDAFSGCKELTSVSVPANVTEIKNCVFYNCEALASVTLGNSVTLIADSAFMNCSALASVPIPESVTSIGRDAFSGCRELSSVSVPANVTEIKSGVFHNCEALASVTLGNSIVSIGNKAFQNCGSLVSIALPESVTSIGSDAFAGCIALQGINISDKVTSIGDRAFQNCSAFVSVSVPGSVKAIGNNVFSGCKSLANATLGNGIVSIGENAFKECGSLVSIALPESVTSIGNYAFTYCTDLESVNIPESVTSIGSNAFSYCTSLESVNIPEGITAIKNNTFTSCSALSEVNLPANLTEIGDYAFYSCRNLESVNIPEKVRTIGRKAFFQCAALKSADIPDGVSAIGEEAFSECNSLESIIIPSGVTAIAGRTFYNCRNLKSATIPERVTEIGEKAFYGCSNLGYIYCHAANPPVCAADCFSGGVDMVSCNLHVPEEAEGAYRTAHVWNKFFNSFNIDGINYEIVSETDGTVAVSLGDREYAGTLEIPASVENGAKTYSVVSVKDGAFMDCSALSGVTLPASITEIGEKAFYGCSNLGDIYCNAAVPPVCAADCFLGLDMVSCNLHVPEEAEGAYRAAPVWEEFFNSFNIGGINYKITSDDDKTVEVISKPERYSGDIVIPASVEREGNTYTVTAIGDGAFSGCTGLASVVIPDNVKSIGNEAFSWCNGLTGVTLGSGLTTIGNDAFKGCGDIAAISVPDGVTMIGSSAFENCRSLKEATLGSGLESIGSRAFAECNILEEIIVPDEVTTIGKQAFVNCGALRSAVIPDKVEVLNDSVFSGCGKLESVILGKALTSIGKGVFDACSGLKTIECLATTPPECGILCFHGVDYTACTLTVPEGTEEAYRNADGWKEFLYDGFFTAGGIRYAIISPAERTVTVVPGQGYSGTIEIPSTVEAENKEGEEGESVTYNVVSISSSAFEGCTDVTKVVIPASITQIGDCAFKGCTGITEISNYAAIPQTLGVSCFHGVDYMTCTLTVPEGAEEVYRNADGWKEFFYDGSFTAGGIRYAIISSAERTVTVVPGQVYSGTIEIPFIVEAENKEGEEGESVTYNVVSISSSAFEGCTGVTEVAIPASIMQIGDYAFKGCTGIKEIYNFAETPQTLGVSCFEGIDLSSKKLYLPSEKAKSAYKAADQWKDFVDNNVIADGYPEKYDISIGTIYVNGELAKRVETEIFDRNTGESEGTTETFVVGAQCGVNEAVPTISPRNGQASVLIDGQEVDGESRIDITAGGRCEVPVTVNVRNIVERTYMLEVCKLPYNIINKRWNDILAVVNNPENNGGLEFTSYKWFVNGTDINCDMQYIYLPEGVSTTDVYSVEVTTTDGITLTSCGKTFPAEKAAVSLYPTVVQGGADMTLNIESDTASDGLSTVYISDMTGRTSKQQVSGRYNTVTAPEAQGTYIVNVITPDKEKTEFKIIVKD